jgi:hypothetical protein
VSSPLYTPNPSPIYTPQMVLPGASGRTVGALNGTTNVVVSEAAPGHGKYRIVLYVLVYNNTGGAIDVNLYHNDGATVRQIDQQLAVANAASYTSKGHWENPGGGLPYVWVPKFDLIYLRDFDTLEVDLGAAGTPNYLCVWVDPPGFEQGAL